MADMIVFGTYTGNGAASQTISLVFTPRAVIILSKEGYTSASSEGVFRGYGGIAFPENPVVYGGYNVLQVVSGGFQVYLTLPDNSIRILINNSGMSFYYIAFR